MSGDGAVLDRLNQLFSGLAKKADGAGRFNELAFAEKFLKQMPPLKTVGANWFAYEAGAWLPRSRAEFGPLALATCPPRHRTSTKAKNLLEHAELKRQVPEQELIGFYKLVADKDGAESILLNVANGVVRIWPGGEMSLEKHDAEHKFTSRAAARFDLKAVAPLFASVLEQQLPDAEDRELLQIFCGNVLWPSSRFEAALVMYGPGGSSKSTIAEAIAETLAERMDRGDLVTSLSMTNLCDSRSYSLFKLRWAALNLTTELDTVDLDESTHFKLLVSGEKMEVRPIYGRPVSMRSTCKLMAVSNSVPRFKHGSSAELRRLRFLVFDVPFGAEDTTLKDRLALERDGIFLWMLEGLLKLQQRRAVPHGGAKARVIREKFAMSNDPVGYFVKARCQMAPGLWIGRERLHEAYNEFLDQNGLPKQVEEWFFRRLYERHGSQVGSERVRTAMSGDREYRVTGMTLLDG